MADYTDVSFSNAKLNGITANKLNLLRDDLSAAIAAGGGGGTGTGDMTKAVYDTNNNGVVDTCDSMPWTGITGKPSTFAPSAHGSTHVTGGSDVIANFTAVTNGLAPFSGGGTAAFLRADGVWTAPPTGGIPSVHASTHITGGSDIIPVATTSAVGLTPIRSGIATTFLDGTGGYSTPSGLAPVAGFITKTAAYTLTGADSGKYLVCSNGSWTLTLPTAAAGLYYQVRNDMGISGTIGTITIARAGAATIDGASSIALLPQQECTIITDGTNWRTFGLKREVIIGTQDITTAAASGAVLLPIGYRYFELEFTCFNPLTNNDYLVVQLSTNGGSTWFATNYYDGVLNNTSATVASFAQEINVTRWTICNSNASGASTGEIRMVFHPGSSIITPVFHADGTSWSGTVFYKWVVGGFYNGSIANAINALKYYTGLGGNFTSNLTVKGVV